MNRIIMYHTANIMRRLMIPVCLVTLAATVSVPAHDALARETLTGVASVIDGDTIEIHTRRIRLHGIDAPESSQTCEKNARPFRCGQQAAIALADRIARHPISCQNRGTDRYGRIIARCRLGKLDLNAWMVRKGWAVAYRRYSTDYINEENMARKAKAGIWAGRFVMPSKWRRGVRLQSKAADRPASASCRIKGNISRGGKRIYHVPGGRYYSRTQINTSKGERWFCSEDEARNAGWRRPLR